MTFAAFFALLPGLFKFWDEVTILIKSLQKTPEEHHQELMTKIQKEADSYATKGTRPNWNS